MRAWPKSIKRWAGHSLTLRWRLALGSAVLLSLISLALVVFVNVAARAALPRTVAIPLLATPPPYPPLGGAEDLTPVPFGAPVVGPNTILKGITVREVQQATLHQVLIISMIGVALAVGVGSVGAYWLAGRALRPVTDLAQVARRVGVRDLGERIVLEGPQDEIKVLADAFDTMLARLERAFDQQDRFVGDAAHELRTPLATLRTNLEIIETDPDATLEDYREMHHTLERSLKQLERLVADLLLLARDEKHLSREVVSLGPLLEEILLELKPLADEHQVSLCLGGKLELCTRGDNGLLASACTNLIENGIRYNQAGGEVVVQLQQEEAWAVIIVADTGIGISAEEQTHIFDRFYRAKRSRSRHRSGTGLGLSIVAHVVEQHGGQVEVESTPNVGSTFIVRLPL